jgi:thioesterase domain-containing protein
MFARVEDEFRKSIPLATLFEAETIEKLANILKQNTWSERESSIVPIQTNGARPPFFCIHAKGGNVLFYRDLSKYLGPDQPFYGVQARRLGGRQVGHSTVEEMAEFYIDEMRSVQPHGPYFLGGSSFGGLVAFEIAQQLDRMGEKVGLLALLDTGTPTYPQMLDNTSRLKLKVMNIVSRIEQHRDSINQFDNAERIEYIAGKLGKVKLRCRRKFNNSYKKFVRSAFVKIRGEGSIPSNYIQLEDQIWRAGQNYVPKPYPGKMILFRATSQPPGIVKDPTLGWRGLSGELEIHDVAGHHGSIVSEPYVRELAAKLEECIQSAIIEGARANEQGSNGRSVLSSNQIQNAVSV